MTTEERPDDLIPIADAARFAERSVMTLRRLIRAGKLTRYEGPPNAPGATPPVLVSLRELQSHLVITQQAPTLGDRSSSLPKVSALHAGNGGGLGEQGEQGGGSVGGDRGLSDQAIRVEHAVMAERLASAEERLRLNTQLAAVTVERDAAVARARWLEDELDRTRREHRELFDRLDSAYAELRALRVNSGPWWRKLLPGG